MSVTFKLASIDGEKFLTVFGADGIHAVTAETHSNFDEILEAAIAGDEEVYDLIDTGRAIQRRFEDTTYGRVSVRNGQVFFDDDVMDNSLTKTILRFLDEGLDFKPLVHFFEKVMANPQPESREQLYRWLEHHEFPLDEDGNIIAYKSVQSSGDGVYKSISSGRAFVNGKEINGRIPQKIGDWVTMPRSEVQHDPNVACHVGLHAGTYQYASGFSGDTLMHVSISPTDVVSVPHDSTSQKVRVCRYEVIGFANKQWDSALFYRHSEPVEDELDVRDTRDNHKFQKRDSSGRFTK